MILGRIHFWFGFFGIIVFILTGQYMDAPLNVGAMDDRERMFYRSAHVYILLSSIVNLFVGVYFNLEEKSFIRYLQYFVSTLLLVVPLIYLGGFFLELSVLENSDEKFYRPFISNASYLILLASVLACFQIFLRKD